MGLEVKHLRQVKFRREFAVFLQGEIPEWGTGYWVGCFETTIALLLEIIGNEIVAKCLQLKLLTGLINSLPTLFYIGTAQNSKKEITYKR
jgi:hypothetical protein